jgi:CyaY protein
LVDGFSGNTSGPFWPQPPINVSKPSAMAKLVVLRNIFMVLDFIFILACYDPVSRPKRPAFISYEERQLMNDSEYHQLADSILLQLEESIDTIEQADLDYESASSILTIEFPNKTKIIINKQAPNHQIWVATKFDGHHFDLIDGIWIDNRTGTEFWRLISDAASKQAGVAIEFAPQ